MDKPLTIEDLQGAMELLRTKIDMPRQLPPHPALIMTWATYNVVADFLRHDPAFNPIRPFALIWRTEHDVHLPGEKPRPLKPGEILITSREWIPIIDPDGWKEDFSPASDE